MDIISCSHISKVFRRQTGPRLLRQHLASFFKRHQTEAFYALKDVTFSVPKGMSIGICGGNGAGKSTLLSLVTGLARPEEGSIVVSGRVAALLELGSGFHPDLTGAENLELNAALLGFSSKQVDSFFDQIVEFSGLVDFIDEPLRTYSNGMVLRLAFSVAVNVAPDILVIDELLAVGDQLFQVKCQDRIRELRRQGTTFVCVSHSAEMLLEFCEMGLWLDHGQVILQGKMSEVLQAYAGRKTANV